MTLSVRLHHALGATVLDLAFEAPPGITVLFGPSGSGKTSVVNAVAGLLRPDAGRIDLNGRVLSDSAARHFLPPHRRRLGYVFQEARLFPHLDVAGNLRYGQSLARDGSEPVDADGIIAMLGIGPLMGRRPGALSGGEKARVALGRALLSGPEMILADEPLASLDEERKAGILPYFERLRDEGRIPILYVSHSAAEVARLATTVVVLEAGRVTRTGPAAEVLSDPGVAPVGIRAAGAVLEARVLRHHADGLTEVAASGLRLLLPRIAQAEGAALRVHVEARDVMIATRRPEGISALNVLPARVLAVRDGPGEAAMVQLDASGAVILSRITRRSVAALGLSPGNEVFAVLKAVSVARGGDGSGQ